MGMKFRTAEEVNREYLAALKAQIEREDKTPVCIDCKVWEGTDEVIVLCKLHAVVPVLWEALIDISRWLEGVDREKAGKPSMDWSGNAREALRLARTTIAKANK